MTSEKLIYFMGTFSVKLLVESFAAKILVAWKLKVCR